MSLVSDRNTLNRLNGEIAQLRKQEAEQMRKEAEANAHFKNVVITEVVENDRDASLNLMRKQMFSDSEFESAVFIGGMSGIFEEYNMLSAIHPKCSMVPVGSTGGAAGQLAVSANVDPELKNDLDYFSLFYSQLNIDPREKRYSRIADQPIGKTDRLQAF
jgi:SLOG cluster3 family